MNAFKVTYTDGTTEEFKAYLLQYGGIVTDENPVTGEETRHQIATVELVETVKVLTCCCCGADAPGRQWYNRDAGYGLCPRCAKWIATRETPETMQNLYGTPGVHYFTEES